MQTFTLGNKRIDVESHRITHVRTVTIDRRGEEQPGTDRLVRSPQTTAEFSRRNQVEHYLGLPPAYVEKYPIFPTNGASWAVVWRGDSRAPDEIFANGFEPRVVGCAEPVWRCAESDVFQPSTVCLSTSILSAALFPLINPGENNRLLNDDTWVYAIRLQKGDPFVNTQWIQLGVAGAHIGSAGGAAALAGANAPAGEICVQRVSVEQLIGAVTVRRTWATTDWTNLGTFQVQIATVRRNTHFTEVAPRHHASGQITGIPAGAQPLVRNGGGAASPFEVPPTW